MSSFGSAFIKHLSITPSSPHTHPSIGYCPARQPQPREPGLLINNLTSNEPHRLILWANARLSLAVDDIARLHVEETLPTWNPWAYLYLSFFPTHWQSRKLSFLSVWISPESNRFRVALLPRLFLLADGSWTGALSCVGSGRRIVSAKCGRVFSPDRFGTMKHILTRFGFRPVNFCFKASKCSHSMILNLTSGQWEESLA